MALVTVRPKDAPKDAPTLVVDEAWIDRWPDDFDVVEDAEETAAHAAISTIPTPGPEEDDARTGDVSAARGRF